MIETKIDSQSREYPRAFTKIHEDLDEVIRKSDRPKPCPTFVSSFFYTYMLQITDAFYALLCLQLDLLYLDCNVDFNVLCMSIPYSQ